MATPRDIRRLALQALYQLDARRGEDEDAVRASIESSAGETGKTYSQSDVDRAYELAAGAYAAREDADRLLRELAPTWPSERQPAVDRAIIRLAHYEMTSGRTPPKAAVNEAVELAKRFSTERSPAFINGVLDKMMRRTLAGSAAADAPASPTG